MSIRYGELSLESAKGLGSAQQPLLSVSRTMNSPPESPSLPNPTLLADKCPALPTIRLRQVTFHAITEAICIRHVMESLAQGKGGVVATPNLDYLRRCEKDIRFGALVAEADVVVADGMPLIWASRLQGTPLPERVAGSDLISSLSAAAAQRDYSIYLLGGAPGTADRAAEILQQRHPTLKIAGTYYPPMGFEKSDAEIDHIVQSIRTTRPDIVYVALGSPKQDLLISQLRPLLPHGWWIGVGNSFSFLSGHVNRAPLWMQKSGLEWAHRLIQEPRRLFKRYIIVGLPFAVSILSAAFLKRGVRMFTRKQTSAQPTPAATPQPSEAVLDFTPPAALNRNKALRSTDGPYTNGSLPPRPPAVHSRSRASGQLARLQGLILLGGSLRPTPLNSRIGRSVLDLPVDEHGSILRHWGRHGERLASRFELPALPIRVLVDRDTLHPATGSDAGTAPIRVEQDRSEFRGSGGVLRDLAEDYADEDLILVGNAAQILMEPLDQIVLALEQRESDISLVAHEDGTPGGLMLLTGAALRMIPRTGFVDMKEQALPLIASRMEVGVVRRKSPTALPVRSLNDYVTALRRHYELREGRPSSADPLAEGWRPIFSLVEEGAAVDPLAQIHDSVVLRGGRVEAGAVLVRSLVCAGGVIRRDSQSVDNLLTEHHSGAK